MIDSHCHLSDPRLREQLDDVLSARSAAGVTAPRFYRNQY